MWYPKIVVANGGALHGPDIGSREGTGSGERCLERRIIPPDFFVKKDWRTHGCDSREEAFFLNGESRWGSFCSLKAVARAGSVSKPMPGP